MKKLALRIAQDYKATFSLVLLFLSLNIVLAQAGDYDHLNAGLQANKLIVDIAEDPSRFSFNTTGPVLEDGSPAYGNPFVTQGYIYPENTLQNGDSGVDSEGNPLYPELVIGEWTCRGVFVGEGMATVSGPIVNTTQLFSFYDLPGYDPSKLMKAISIVTEGFELVDIGVPIKRAITGGTGKFKRANGEAEQELLAISEQLGVSLRIRLGVRR